MRIDCATEIFAHIFQWASTLKALLRLRFVCSTWNTFLDEQFIDLWIASKTHPLLTLPKLRLPEYRLALNQSCQHRNSIKVVKRSHFTILDTSDLRKLRDVKSIKPLLVYRDTLLEWESISDMGPGFLVCRNIDPKTLRINPVQSTRSTHSLLHLWFTFMDRSPVSLDCRDWQVSNLEEFLGPPKFGVQVKLEHLPSSRSLIFSVSFMSIQNCYCFPCISAHGINYYVCAGWFGVTDDFCWNGLRGLPASTGEPDPPGQFSILVVDTHTQRVSGLSRSLVTVSEKDTLLKRVDWFSFLNSSSTITLQKLPDLGESCPPLLCPHLSPEIAKEFPNFQLRQLYFFLLAPYAASESSWWNHSRGCFMLKVELMHKDNHNTVKFFWKFLNSEGQMVSRGSDDLKDCFVGWTPFPILYWINPNCLVMDLYHDKNRLTHTHFFHLESHPLLK